MSNELTGDYDVVVQFSTGAVNRVLAAMHSGNRLLHSLSTRVDDNPAFSRLVTAAMDGTAHAISDPNAAARFRAPLVAVAARAPVSDSRAPTGPLIERPPDSNMLPHPPPAASRDAQATFTSGASTLINTQATISELLKQVDHYSHLHGVAQMQIGCADHQSARRRSARHHPHSHEGPLHCSTATCGRGWRLTQTRSSFRRGASVRVISARRTTSCTICLSASPVACN